MLPSSRLSIYLKRIDILLQTIVTCVLTLFFCIIALPLLLLLGFIFRISRQVAVTSAKIFKRGQLAKPLALLSSTMANLDQIYTSPYNTISNAMILEGVVDMDRIRDTVKRQLLEKLDPKTGEWLYPELLQNVSYWMGYPFWRKLNSETVNPEWFLKECVRFYKDDEKQVSNYQILEDVLNKLSFTPFSKDKPLIEIIILPNYTPHPKKNSGLDPNGTYFVAIVRVHHALADGFSIFKIGENLSTLPDPFQYVQGQDYTKQKKLERRSLFTKFLTNLTLFLKMMYELTEVMFKDKIFASKNGVWPKTKSAQSQSNSIRKPVASWESAIKITTPINSATKNYELLNQKRLRNLKTAHGNPFSISEINEIKKYHGVSGTTVLFSAMVGAVRKTMFSNTRKNNPIIPPCIGVSVPLLLPGRSEKLRNRFTVGIMYIPFSEPNPVKRLHKIQERIKILQKSTIPAGLALITTIIFGQLPRWALLLVEKKRSQGMELVAVTNVAGPKRMFDFGGYPMRDFCGGSGIPTEKRFPFLNLSSMGGRARLCVMSDSAVIDSDEMAQELADNFILELEILREAGKHKQQHHSKAVLENN